MHDEPKVGANPNPAGAQDQENQPAQSNLSPEEQIQAAMDEAVAAVERAEGASVTEAIIKARQELELVLEQTRKEVENFREKWLRSAADLENYRKRAAREREETIRFGNEKLLRDFLPLLDDLERAVDIGGQSPADGAHIVEGVRLVHKKFIGQLEKHGVATFEAVGTPFDPNRHEAVQQMHGEHPAGMVMTQLQRGFLLNDRLLRPALVVVSLGPQSAPSGSEGESATESGDN